MIVAQKPFVAAISEHGDQYRWMVERHSSKAYLSDSTVLFMLIINASLIFWFTGAALVILTHSRKTPRNQRKQESSC